MVYAVIFAGGVGRRMEINSMPKQFIPIHSKPLIIHTLEKFQEHKEVDGIVVACIETWIDKLWALLGTYGITKVIDIVPGGDTGHDSIRLGLERLRKEAGDEDIVLIHDAVRPLISYELISRNIEAVRKYGSAITSEGVRESVVESRDGQVVDNVPFRDYMYVAKAPQSFHFGDIYGLYAKALAEDWRSIDSAHLCQRYSFPMHLIKSPRHNMKITDPLDYYMCCAIFDMKEREALWEK
ncbi:MAG: 2-C-methyl-D-erythritol 4-phosphate cytidylyltransferase [Selenomonas ruminantium]|nr:2-C-methyl-D-erythritol 4-phosphate cytidylyltransferase [Selenomonas ruminantium]